MRRTVPVVAAIAVAVGASVVGGTAVVMSGARGEQAGSERAPVPSAPPGRSGLSDTSGPAVSDVQGQAALAPLRRVVPPDLLAVATSSVSDDTARKIAKLPRVQDVIVVDAGAVQLQGRKINTFAVDPSRFRSWTPPGTAKRQALWGALAQDRLVVSDRAKRALGLLEGRQYPIVARSSPFVTMGGAGPLGLPGVDMLVSRKTGAQIGLVPNLALMVNAPGANPAKLAPYLRKILGGRAQVLNLHARKNRVAQAGSYLELYQRGARLCPGLSWSVLAAIGQIESGHGRNTGPSTAGALGPMQFLPTTWRAYGVDGDRDGRADIMNPYDAVPAAARYLCANGAGGGGRQLYTAIWRYNHADWYVQQVLALARAYAQRFA
ncbi:MAG TPA: lytic transglycosylase domain-containing protein [Streptosporangiaceae bacterium]|nr:lytic transglycosylase domain-containing protein [Streptosporangiaceae bacterium]